MKVFLSVLLLISSGHMVAQGNNDGAAITRVLALEHAWNQAEERKDTKALDALFDNSLVYVDYDGSRMTKAEFLSHVKSAALQPQQESTEAMTSYVYGNTIVVTGVYLAKGIDRDKPFSRRGRFTDTWVLNNGSWLCVASQATPILH